MNNKEYLHAKAYITRTEGNCWIGQKINNGSNMKMVSRYSDDMLFSCEYDGESLGDEFETRNADEALAWLYADREDMQEEHPIISEENCLKMWEAYPEEKEEIDEILAELGF